jgi:5-methylcytosine-specific restriction endonuclease McrA
VAEKPKQFKKSSASSGKSFVKKASPERRVVTDLYKSKDWTIFRFRFLHHNKFCYACGERSQVVDHWQAHKGDVDLFWKPDNFIPLCSKCHNFCTASFDRVSPPKTLEKLEYLKKVRNERGLTFSVVVIKPKLETNKE